MNFRHLLLLGLLTAGLGLVACSSSPPPATVSPATVAFSPPVPISLRLLYTSDEHGWIAPVVEKDRRRGGAPELLARWIHQEQHCVPSVTDSCTSSSTLALSGGDHWTGPALSSYFNGAPAAEALKLIGYTASALGNHELDFGREIFAKNASIQQIPYVGANVKPWLDAGGITKPYLLVHRQGITIGVVGVSAKDTPKSGMRDNYKGLDFQEEEAALVQTIPEVYAKGADAVVLVAHVCASELRPMLARHPEWRLAFAGAGHCHRTSLDRVFSTPLVEVGSYFQKYARISLSIDRTRFSRERVLSSEAELIDLTSPASDPPPVPPDPTLSKLVSDWQEKTEKALGEVIGHTSEELLPDSTSLANFLTDRWREMTKADVAFLNRYGTRQAIPKGPISLGTIYSVLPFNNALVTMHLTGEQIIQDVTCCEAHVSGVKYDSQGQLILADGRPIDLSARYTVVATDYTYFGGSGFPFEKQDPSASFGEDWRLPLLRWFRKNPTSPEHGIERFLDRTPRLERKQERRP